MTDVKALHCFDTSFLHHYLEVVPSPSLRSGSELREGFLVSAFPWT